MEPASTAASPAPGQAPTTERIRPTTGERGDPAEEGRHPAVSSRIRSGTLGGVIEGTTETVDGVVDGAGETVSGVVDGTTDVVDDLLGGSAVSDLVDEPVEDLTDLLGGLLGS